MDWDELAKMDDADAGDKEDELDELDDLEDEIDLDELEELDELDDDLDPEDDSDEQDEETGVDAGRLPEKERTAPAPRARRQVQPGQPKGVKPISNSRGNAATASRRASSSHGVKTKSSTTRRVKSKGSARRK